MTPSFPTRRSSCLGGAAIYVAEHAPTEKRGFYTSFIQASVIGGFLLSLIVVLLSGAFVDQGRWESWGWRIPFLFSLVLLAVSLWMRLKLKERSEEHTSELQSLMRISYPVFCSKNKNTHSENISLPPPNTHITHYNVIMSTVNNTVTT